MDGTSSGLGKLIPRSITKRRRRREESIAETTGSNSTDEATAERELMSRSTTASSSDHHDTSQESQGSESTELTIPGHSAFVDNSRAEDEGDGGSFVSYDSDLESLGSSPFSRYLTLLQMSDIAKLREEEGGRFIDSKLFGAFLSSSRPTAISTHPSQIGYLTTSSPLVQAAHHPDSYPLDSRQTSDFTQRAAESSNLESSLDSLDSDPNHRAPAAPSRSQYTGTTTTTISSSSSSLAPGQTLARPSSIGRLRDAFRSKKGSAKSASPNSSPERKSQSSERGRASEPTEPARPPASASASATDPAATPKSSEADNPDPNAAAPKVTASDRIRRLSRGQKIDTSTPPRTPPNGDAGTPTIVNTPPTPTDRDFADGLRRQKQGTERPATAAPAPAAPEFNASPKGTMIAQRRGRSLSASIGPSKLSTITSAPLTPTPETIPTTPGSSASNFFTSMISAVQNTANTLSNTISNTNLPGGNKTKQPPKDLGDIAEDAGVVEVESSVEAVGDQSEAKEPAVKTLGMGDLSLSQLGLAEPAASTSGSGSGGSTSPLPASAKFADQQDTTRARSESAPVDHHSTTETLSDDSHGALARPLSLYDPVNGSVTPPPGSIYEGKAGVQRSGSIRSAIGRRRKRGSSVATGTSGMTIGAAIVAANASVANPSTNAAASGTPKLTGFAVANKRRNRDFHALFKSVPDDDYLIEDYSCALQREILAHGRLYISEGTICFSSNIFGWVTTLVMSFDEIVAVEKRSTALVFKNGLEISTLHAKHIFASFASRDTTYDLIVKIWKLGHPSLKSSLNGVRLDETGGDRTEKVETESISVTGSQSISGSEEESDEGEDVYEEDEDDHDALIATQPTDAAAPEPGAEKAVSRKPSMAVNTNGAAEKADDGSGPSALGDFPGPATHAPTDCGDAAAHYERAIADDVIQAPLGKVYSLLFGPASVQFMPRWLSTDQKCTEFQMEDKKGLTEDNKTRNFSYIKPLNTTVGPKQTKCIVTEQIENLDLEKAVNIHVTTQTPDVPSGNVFSVKTKYCFSWAENNATRIQVNCTIEWTGKSWFKGPIEKGTNDGQKEYCGQLFASIKAAVSLRSSPAANGATSKGLKKRRKGKLAQASNPASDAERLSKAAAKKDWGFFEPAHPLLGPVLDIIKPLITGNVVYGLLVGLLVAAWFGFGTTRPAPRPYPSELGYLDYPHRIAAYEEMWRREESELWEWLEERLTLDRVQSAISPRKKAMEQKSVGEKIREDGMHDREIREAIRVTEEHLEVLKSAIDKSADAIPGRNPKPPVRSKAAEPGQEKAGFE